MPISWTRASHPMTWKRAVPVALVAFAGAAQTLGAPPFPVSFNLSTLNGTNGFVLNGIDAGDASGISVSSAGDVNGDGIDDLIVGARLADPGGRSNAGESYVVFGKATPFAASVNLSALDGTNGFVINGVDLSDNAGISVDSAGDVNGDSIDDLIIGAWAADPNGQPNAGESYVVFGKATPFAASLNLSALNGANGFVLNGIIANDQSGGAVSAAGDVNGDGFGDLIIGARYADPNGQSNAGESYVVFGKATPFAASLNLSALNGANGFILNGIAASDQSGGAVSAAGDVNGDGFDDILIGAAEAQRGGSYAKGESYVVFGAPAVGSGGIFNLSNLNGTNGFICRGIDPGDYSGRSVSAAGDVNGDGFGDILIGAPQGVYGSGEAYVVLGGAAVGASGNIYLSALNGTNGFVVTGINLYDLTGSAVSCAGDVNGDGIDDIMVGARRGDAASQSDNDAGETFVVFGGVGVGAGGSISLFALGATAGFVCRGIDPQDFSGRSVSSVGDVNGDGVDDFIIGAYQADPNGQGDAGESYVVFGRLVASIWNNPEGGGFGTNANWQDGLTPTANDLTVFDNALTGLPDSAFTVVLPLASPRTVRALRVRSDDVTLNLNGSAFTMGTASSLALPGLTVGGRFDEPARLRLFNSQLLQTLVTTSDIVVGPEPTSTITDPLSRLTVDGSATGLAIANRLWVGRGASSAQCWVLSGADATVGGEMRLGVEPGSEGQIRIAQGGSTLTLGSGAQRIVVGDAGAGSVEITGGGGLEAASVLDSVAFAQGPASIATLLLTGLGSRWITAQDDLIIGGAGDALVEITGGAELRTDTSNQLIVGRDAGSSAEIVISGAGSTWTELTQSIAVGGAGSATIRLENGASLASIIGVNVRSLGMITGDGAISAPSVTNFGTIDPGSDLGAGTMQITGSYRQTGTPPSGGGASGAVDIDIFGTGAGQFDRLAVTGDVELAGRIRIALAPGFTPNPSALDQLELITGATNFEGSRFDVALMPNLGASDFLSVAYDEGTVRTLASVSLQVNSLTGDVELDPQTGADSGEPGIPKGATLGDIDNDGDPDLLIALPDAINPTTATGSVVVLYNDDDGDPGNGWEGFGDTLQITAGVGVNPSSVALGRIDADTLPDIVVSNRGTPGATGDDTVSVLLVSNPGAATFTLSATPTLTVGDEPTDVFIADLDTDGILDIVTADAGSSSVSIAWNAGAGTGPSWSPQPPSKIDLPDEDDVPVSVRPGDTNASAFAFLATANSGTNSIGLIQINPNRSTAVLPNIPAGNAPVEIVVTDFNLDGEDDIATVNRNSSSITLVLGNTGPSATLAMGLPSDLPIPSASAAPRSIAAGDFDSDANGDIDIAILADGVIKVLRNDLFNGQLAFAPIADQPAGSSPLLVRSADLNVDGRDDVVTVAESTGLRSRSGERVADAVNILLAAPEPCPGDITGDGFVNTADFNVFAANFGAGPGASAPQGDLTGDGFVNTADFNILAGDFGCGS